MNLERSKFKEELEEPIRDSNKRGNVIQGPWPARKFEEPEIPEEIPRPERKNNVIPGPWPKRELAPEEPGKKSGEKSQDELALEKAKKELGEIADRDKNEEIQTKPKDPEDGGKRTRYAESEHKPKVCEFCQGKGFSGRRFLFFKNPCSFCEGLGYVMEEVYREEGYYQNGERVVEKSR